MLAISEKYKMKNCMQNKKLYLYGENSGGSIYGLYPVCNPTANSQKVLQISSYIDLKKGVELLYLGQKQLNSGDTVVALFPSGWEKITICLCNCEGTDPKWYIQNSRFSDYSPIGLFAANVYNTVSKH